MKNKLRSRDFPAAFAELASAACVYFLVAWLLMPLRNRPVDLAAHGLNAVVGFLLILLATRPADPRITNAGMYLYGYRADPDPVLFFREGPACNVLVEAPRQRGGGNMDILARRAAENVAIEIETGKSNVVSNVKRDLLHGVQKVIVVATDECALGRIERQLARAGLFLPGRLDVGLQDAAVLGSD